jgi:hypothetical protein
MITYTILDRPVNMDQLCMAFALKGEPFKPLVQHLAQKVTASFYDHWLENDNPDVCPICGEGTPTHYPPACEDCVLEGRTQCHCCTQTVELVYDIEGLGYQVSLTDQGQLRIVKPRAR